MTIDQTLEPKDKHERELCDLAGGIFESRYNDYKDNTSFKKDIYKSRYQRFILSCYRNKRDEWKDNYISGIKEVYNYYKG